MMLYLLAVIGLLYGGAHSLTDEEWEQWKITHRKTYQNVAVEESRRQVWSSNYKLIQEHNMKESSFKLALNHFGDLVRDESHESIIIIIIVRLMVSTLRSISQCLISRASKRT